MRGGMQRRAAYYVPPAAFCLARGVACLAQRQAEAWPSVPVPPPLSRLRRTERAARQPVGSRFPRVVQLRGLAPPRLRRMAVKKIAIFGATGRTGLTTLAQAVQAGMSWGGRGMSAGCTCSALGRGLLRLVGPSVLWFVT